MDNEPENEITITVFRLLVLDLLALFQVLNHALINILGKIWATVIPAVLLLIMPTGHFFEMSRPDAERAMEVYRNFTRQTDQVVQYLSVARQYEHHTRVEVPQAEARSRQPGTAVGGLPRGSRFRGPPEAVFGRAGKQEQGQRRIGRRLEDVQINVRTIPKAGGKQSVPKRRWRSEFD